jgi:hypothetical protein
MAQGEEANSQGGLSNPEVRILSIPEISIQETKTDKYGKRLAFIVSIGTLVGMFFGAMHQIGMLIDSVDQSTKKSAELVKQTTNMSSAQTKAQAELLNRMDENRASEREFYKALIDELKNLTTKLVDEFRKTRDIDRETKEKIVLLLDKLANSIEGKTSDDRDTAKPNISSESIELPESLKRHSLEKHTLSEQNLSCRDATYTNFSGADLSNADLRGTDLRYAFFGYSPGGSARIDELVQLAFNPSSSTEVAIFLEGYNNLSYLCEACVPFLRHHDIRVRNGGLLGLILTETLNMEATLNDLSVPFPFMGESLNRLSTFIQEFVRVSGLDQPTEKDFLKVAKTYENLIKAIPPADISGAKFAFNKLQEANILPSQLEFAYWDQNDPPSIPVEWCAESDLPSRINELCTESNGKPVENERPNMNPPVNCD